MSNIKHWYQFYQKIPLYPFSEKISSMLESYISNPGLALADVLNGHNNSSHLILKLYCLSDSEMVQSKLFEPDLDLYIFSKYFFRSIGKLLDVLHVYDHISFLKLSASVNNFNMKEIIEVITDNKAYPRRDYNSETVMPEDDTPSDYINVNTICRLNVNSICIIKELFDNRLDVDNKSDDFIKYFLLS